MAPKLLYFLLPAVFLAPTVFAYSNFQIYVMEQNSSTVSSWAPVWECEATGATFGFQLDSDKELVACAVPVTPADACVDDVRPAAPLNASQPCPDYFAIADRGNCSFVQKAKKVEMASESSRVEIFMGLLVANYADEDLSIMSGDDETVTIPVFMISQACAQLLATRYAPDKGYKLVVKRGGGGSGWLPWLSKLAFYPALAIISFCAIVMAVELIVKFVRDRRRRQRRRLSTRNLRKIPTKKYKKVCGEEADTCAICLDDFEDGDKLRVLPCNHSYHCKCIDPWLTKTRKVCPVCKRKVCPSKDDSSESEAEAESGGASTSAPTNSSNAEPTSTADGAPLIPESPPSQPNSRFFVPTPQPQQQPPRRLRRVLDRVVPGFMRRSPPVSHAPPEAPPPVAEPTDAGAANDGFDQLPDEEVVEAPRARGPRRKRHPAHHTNVPVAANTRLSLQESADEADQPESERARARTHVQPPPLAAAMRGQRRPRRGPTALAASAPAVSHIADDDDDHIGTTQA